MALRSIKLLILYGIRRNCLRSGNGRSFYLLIRKVIKQIARSNYRGISLLSTTYNNLSNILFSKLSLYAAEIIVDHQ